MNTVEKNLINPHRILFLEDENSGPPHPRQTWRGIFAHGRDVALQSCSKYETVSPAQPLTFSPLSEAQSHLKQRRRRLSLSTCSRGRRARCLSSSSCIPSGLFSEFHIEEAVEASGGAAQWYGSSLPLLFPLGFCVPYYLVGFHGIDSDRRLRGWILCEGKISSCSPAILVFG